MYAAITRQGQPTFPSAARVAVSEHAVLLAVLAAGTIVRLGVLITYPSGLFYSDSWSYLDVAWKHFPTAVAPDRPAGYPFFLHLFAIGHQLDFVFVLQQLGGVALAAGAAFVLLRLGVSKWLAVVVAAVTCLDGNAMALAQNVMAEPVSLVLTFASCALLALSTRPRNLVLSALLLAASVCTRSVVIFAVPAWIAYLLIRRRPRPKAIAAAVAALVLPLVLYASAVDVKFGSFGLNAADGWFLYGRVAPIARCSGLSVPADQRFLCTDSVERPDRWSSFYIYNPASPANLRFGSNGPFMNRDRVAGTNALLLSFSRRMIVDHPGAYAKLAGDDFLRYFEPGVGSHDKSSDSVLRLPARAEPLPTAGDRALQRQVLPGYEPRAGSLAPALSALRAHPAHPALAAGLRRAGVAGRAGIRARTGAPAALRGLAVHRRRSRHADGLGARRRVRPPLRGAGVAALALWRRDRVRGDATARVIC